jgi:putative peptidoglycan lipid II flippase
VATPPSCNTPRHPRGVCQFCRAFLELERGRSNPRQLAERSYGLSATRNQSCEHDTGLGRDMLRSLIVVTMFAAIAGGARLAQDAAIAWRHGAGSAADAFYFVNNIVNWPVTVALSTLTLVISPIEAVLRSNSTDELRRFRSELFGLVLVLAVVALPMGYWALQTVTSSSSAGLVAATTDVAVAGGRVAFAVVSLGLVSALFSAWLIASGRHVVNLLEAIPAIFLVVTILAASAALALFWGLVVGYALQVTALALVLRTRGELPRPRLGLSSNAWFMLWRGGVALLVGQLLFALVPLVDQFFAARLGEGVLASLSFANRLILGLQGLAGLALQRASLPIFSEVMSSSPANARRAATRWALIAGSLGVLIAASVALLAEPIVTLLFERGSFTAQVKAEVVALLRYGMLQLPAFLAGLVFVTALASARAVWLLALAAAGGLLVKTAMNFALVPIYGVVGLQIATALMYLFTALLAWAALRRGPRTPE